MKLAGGSPSVLAEIPTGTPTMLDEIGSSVGEVGSMSAEAVRSLGSVVPRPDWQSFLLDNWFWFVILVILLMLIWLVRRK